MRTIIAIFIAYFTFNTVQAQDRQQVVINSSGGAVSSGYYYFEWSIGELAIVDKFESAGNNLSITNGFIQPYVLKPGPQTFQHFFTTDEIKIFPNPATTYVEINFMIRQKGKIRFTFFDALGKHIFSKEIISEGVDIIERIPVSYFPNGTYALKINLMATEWYNSKTSIYKISKID